MSAQSGFFERLRRPRTSQTREELLALRLGGSDIAASSDDVSGQSPARGRIGSSSNNRLNLVARAAAGLPRSISSSQVNRVPQPEQGDAAGSSTPGRPRNNRTHSSSRSAGNILFPGAGDSTLNDMGSPTASGLPQSSSYGGLGRMLRRYSQGHDRAQAAAEARAAEETAAVGQSPTQSDRRATRRSEDRSRQSDSEADGPRGSRIAEQSTSSGASGTRGREAESAVNGAAAAAEDGGANSQQPPVHRIRLVPNLEATRSLHFEPVERDVIEGAGPVKIGRFTDRGQSNSAPSANVDASVAGRTATGTILGGGLPTPSELSSNGQRRQGAPGARGGAIPSSAGGAGRVDTGRIAFKSKVVSRGHAEIWCEAGGKFYIKDTKSSSGTFLNHIRLSGPNSESRPHLVKDGDVVQLGVDYQGGMEEIYRCVKMRVELNRGWQRGANEYNINALRQLDALRGNVPSLASTPNMTESGKSGLPTNREALSVTDCCICLYTVSVCQALFIAPCSHVYHFKCIRPLINRHFPGFQCPLCRTFADLDAEVERDDAWQEELLRAEIASREDAGRAALHAVTPSDEAPAMSFATAAQIASGERQDSANDPTSAVARSESPSPRESDNLQSDEAGALPAITQSSEASAIDMYTSPDPSHTQRFGLDAFSPGLNEAGTPQNEHFLSTLAEAPPPPRASMRSINIGSGRDYNGSVGDVYSTPLQGNSPVDPSPLATMMAEQDGSDGVAPPPISKGKAPQALGVSPPPTRTYQGTPLRADNTLSIGNGSSPSEQKSSSNSGSASHDKRSSVRSDRSGSGESSRDTHRSGESTGGSGTSGAAATNGAATSHTPASPGSSGKLARFFSRASSQVANSG